MKSLLLSLTLLFPFVFSAFSQNETQIFGKVDQADLELKECHFEKDANAMVLFDKQDVYFDDNFDIVMQKHVRIKIFNEKAKDEANIKLEYYGGNRLEYLTNLQAQTINLSGGKPTVIKVDKKSIFTQTVDKSRSAIVFTFPDVQAGSILEYKYVLRTVSVANFPDWHFQTTLPVRYSELKTAIPEAFYYKTQIRSSLPYLKNLTSKTNKSIGAGSDAYTYTAENTFRAIANIPSLTDEPYMSSRADNQQCILFQLNRITPTYGFTKTAADTWPKVGKLLLEDEDFGKQLKRKLSGEEEIISKAKSLKSDQDRIRYIFNEVKNSMKWNDIDRWYTNDGVARAWEKKTGNSTEINLALYHLLKESGLNVFPMVVSTRNHGKVQIAYPSVSNFNKTVAYIPIDSTRHFILDATSKYNVYNEIPSDLLNSFGLFIDTDKDNHDLISLMLNDPARESIFLQAQITPKGTVEGQVRISSTKYHKLKCQEQYKKEGEVKYKDLLKGNNNGLNILSFKIENVDVDTLPVTQIIDFSSELTGSDDDYIYVNASQFLPLKNNPFVSENRVTDIDFGFKNSYVLSGMYKLPQGFKVDALPKSTSLTTPDQSIVFRRVAGEQDGGILIRYSIEYKKSMYFKEDYLIIRDFYQQMFDMLNESIVLKKI